MTSAELLPAHEAIASSAPALQHTLIILYPSRWLNLCLFSLVTAWNAFLWIAFAPRLRLWMDFFELQHPFYVNLFSVVFMVAFPIFLYVG